MFETQKIDSFFSGEKNLLDEEEKIFISRRTKVVRFFKLFLPCLTALLLGLGVILFDFETNQETPFTLADDERVYFEKFRMKNTVFEITEKDNQLSLLKASVVEEIEPNSKIYDLQNPAAQTIENGRVMTIEAKEGTYNQNTQVLDLKIDVVGNYDQDMTIKTNSVSYNFQTEEGFGDEKIVGSGNKGYFEADKFKFNKKKGIIELIKNVYMKNDKMQLSSPDKAILYQNDNKFIANNAVFHKGDDIIQGDVLTAIFKDTKSYEIKEAYSKGHTAILSGGKRAYANRAEYNAETDVTQLFDKVKIIDSSGYTATAKYGVLDKKAQLFTLKDHVVVEDKSGYKAVAKVGIYDLSNKTFTLQGKVKIDKGTNVVTAPKAVYFMNKDEFRFYDKVKVTQDGGTATAKSGVYYVKRNIAELENDVVITKKGNVVHGNKAISDFNTSVSRIVGKEGGRIFGKLLESSFKKKEKE